METGLLRGHFVLILTMSTSMGFQNTLFKPEQKKLHKLQILLVIYEVKQTDLLNQVNSPS